MTESHWLPGERRGLGDLVVAVNHIALIVADVGRSTTFYSDVLGLQQIQRPNFDRHGAWMTAGNVEIHLIKGTPLVHTGENLIVSHIALGVSDPALAFARLRAMRIPFEINVSVPKGEGKAESEGGGRDNTLSQAFLRDPDGYYIELCNCNILTDFALGRSSGLVDAVNHEASSAGHTMIRDARMGNMSFYCFVKLAIMAARAKKRCREFRNKPAKQMLGHYMYYNRNNIVIADDHAAAAAAWENKEDSKVEPSLVFENFCCRREVYGDICQCLPKIPLSTNVLKCLKMS